MTVTQTGYSDAVLIQSLYKRLIDAAAGRGGVEALCQFLDQLSWIETLRTHREQIKNHTVFFEYAVAKCHKEMLKRPLADREDEIFKQMGSSCNQCGFKTSLWSAFDSKGCQKCGGKLEPSYSKTALTMIQQRMETSPEAILMYEAYDRLAEAYINIYDALQTALKNVAQLFKWEIFFISNPEIRNYMDQYKLGRLSGEQRIPREEKQVLQFIVFGTLADIPLEDASKLIRAGLKVVKYGYLFQVLGIMGAEEKYQEAIKEYHAIYDKADREAREKLMQIYGQEAKPTIRMKKPIGGYYPPFLQMAHCCWASGQLSKDLLLEPIYKLPVFPKYDFSAIQTIYAPSAGGKSFLISSIACYSIHAKKSLVFCPLNDKSNSLIFASMPLFAYDKRTEELHRFLTEMLEVEPQGVPNIILNFLMKGEKIEDVKKFPPTKHDVIVEIQNPLSFTLDFDDVLSRLKEVASDYGYSRPVGMINVRNMDRFLRNEKINIDIEVASSFIDIFDKWRKGRITQPARLIIDEVSYSAASQVVLYASDALHSQATISDLLKEARRSNLAVDLSTQRPLEVISDLRDSGTNIFFRELPKSKEKVRSQLDYLLDSIHLQDVSLREVIKELIEKGSLGKKYWFWYHQPTRKIRVIRPCPPTFCLQDPRRTALEVYKQYEKKFGEKILMDSWDKVSRIKAETVEMGERKTSKAPSLLP